MAEIKQLWVDKYRPQKLDDYILSDDLRQYFKNMISSNSLQSLTFAGVQGAGKTTLARILCNEFNAEMLFVKCATEGTVDVIRSKIEPFCNACSLDGKLKVVVLDEVDSASSSTGSNSFQLALRTLIEAAQDDTRFLLTCNLATKVFPAILSRCILVPLGFDKKDLLLHVKKILDLEGIKYTKDSLKKFVTESFSYYPDCRRIINYLQFCCNTGELIVKLNAIADTEKEKLVSTIVNDAAAGKSVLAVRKTYLNAKLKITDFVEFGSLMFNYVVDNEIVKDPGAVLKMADLCYQLNQCVDKEPQFFALLVLVQKAASIS